MSTGTVPFPLMHKLSIADPAADFGDPRDTGIDHDRNSIKDLLGFNVWRKRALEVTGKSTEGTIDLLIMKEESYLVIIVGNGGDVLECKSVLLSESSHISLLLINSQVVNSFDKEQRRMLDLNDLFSFLAVVRRLFRGDSTKNYSQC